MTHTITNPEKLPEFQVKLAKFLVELALKEERDKRSIGQATREKEVAI